MSLRYVWLALSVLVLLALHPVAHARPNHKVPDLRRGATRGSLQVSSSHRTIQVPLTLHIVADQGGTLVSVHRVARWIERANAALYPHGIEVSVRALRVLPAGFQEVTRWRDRRDLARFSPQDGTVHVFVVDRLDLYSVRPERRRVRGMHWRYRGFNRDLARREYVVVTDDAPNTTLAHELGHLFGLRHDTGAKNLMCSCRRGPGQAFTLAQGFKMRTGAVGFLARQNRARIRQADRARR